MKKVQTNCRNCGAVIKTDKCQYCGTVLIDWAVIDMNDPFYLKFKWGNKIVRAKCILNSFRQEFNEPSVLYADDGMYMPIRHRSSEINISLIVIPVDGIEYVVIDEDVVDPDDLKEYWKDGDEE